MPRKTLLIFILAHLFIAAGTHASESLRPPEIYSYNEEGVTQGTIRAAWSTVIVGNSQYESLVFNEKYDSPLIRTRPGGVMNLTLDNQMAEKNGPSLSWHAGVSSGSRRQHIQDYLAWRSLGVRNRGAHWPSSGYVLVP